jgi:hypothetical protein
MAARLTPKAAQNSQTPLWLILERTGAKPLNSLPRERMSKI